MCMNYALRCYAGIHRWQSFLIEVYRMRKGWARCLYTKWVAPPATARKIHATRALSHSPSCRVHLKRPWCSVLILTLRGMRAWCLLAMGSPPAMARKIQVTRDPCRASRGCPASKVLGAPHPSAEARYLYAKGSPPTAMDRKSMGHEL